MCMKCVIKRMMYRQVYDCMYNVYEECGHVYEVCDQTYDVSASV